MPRDIFRLGYSVRMDAENSDTAEIMLYGQIVEDGPKWWKWSEEDKSAADFDKAVKEVREKGAKKLLLRINSPGGVCTESIAMRAILGNAGFEEINIRIEGMCASAATDIATLPGAHVAICEGSEYMIHNPWCMALGNANELEHTIERLRNIEEVSRGFYAKKSGQSEERIKEWMDAETWFTAEQAVEYGFADELLEAEVTGETPAAACASSREMAAMRGLYKAVPEQIAVREEETEAPQETDSNEAPVAGDSTVIHHEEETHSMEIKDITQEQLLAENPALLEQIQQAALTAERQRQEDIDAITPPAAEYQAMAEEAKKKGTPFTEYQRALVAAQKQKGANHLAARQEETAPAQNIAGGAAETPKNEDEEIKQNAEDMAKYAKEYRGNADGGMY
ncbi:MAG: ATP-dependent Clp protease proteolytic subunit [Clostridia bacterium]|nr:ATP-dependent Clp protease proteolytic subunit [Clostridia bacterium]